MRIDDNMAQNIREAYRKAILTVFGTGTDEERDSLLGRHRLK